jgi:ribosome-associated protein
VGANRRTFESARARFRHRLSSAASRRPAEFSARFSTLVAFRKTLCLCASVANVRERDLSVTLRITDTIAIEEKELEERFVRASGPGGQNVNKVSTAVELRFDVQASSLPADVKGRLLVLAGNRMTSDGVLLIDSREHRTQAQNRDAARARLVALLQHAAKRPKTRRPTRPRKAAKEQRLATKKRRSEVKSLRGRGSHNDE